MAQHELNLFPSHSGEPLKEVVNAGPAFKILE